MSEPIRILQVVTTMNRGGLETMLMNYFRSIDRSKVMFDFAEHRAEQSAYDTEIEELGGRIYRFPTLVPWSKSYKKAWRRFFREHTEYHIIHVHQDCLSGVILKEAKRAGVAVRIAHSHNANQDHNLKYLIKLLYKKQIPSYATDLFACGKEAGDWMFDGADYRILTNAIKAKDYRYSPEIRKQIREDLGLEDSFVIGTVGRFSHQKNHTFLLDVFAEVARRDKTAKLLLVGDGELRADIEQKIANLELKDKVILTGIRSDVPRLLQAIDVYVMPSLYEGLSLAIVEAQAAGLPCIISDHIPKECKITDLVQQVLLADSGEIWAEEILMQKEHARRDTYMQIAAAGFDVEENAEWLQEYYLKKIPEK